MSGAGGSKLHGIVAAALVLWCGTAYADPRGYGPSRWDRAHPRHRDSDVARVLHVEPITRRIRVSEPRRECYEETRYEEPRYEEPRWRSHGRRASYGESRPAAGHMILGGVLGAAVGNQIGSGDGRRAATVAGALIGSALGHDAAARRDARESAVGTRWGHGYHEPPRAYTVERCDLRYEDRWDERIEGYWVTYEYHGREYRTRMPYDPGRELRVHVDVIPQR